MRLKMFNEVRSVQELIATWHAREENPDYVFFWGHTGDKINKGVFSQWKPAEFVVNGITYKTAEHWMMAEKARLFQDDESLQKILKSKTPAEAKKLGRKVKNFDVKVWEEQCFEFVVQGNVHKFGQNQELLEFILSTDNKVLVEASPYDKIWGIGMNQNDVYCVDPLAWKGKNLLGFALMEARERLKKGYKND